MVMRGDWCILRTSEGRTLPLARSLADAGFEVWAPARTIKRPAPGQRRCYVLGQRRKMVEIDVPILGGYVFAKEHHFEELVRLSADPTYAHPAFSILHLRGHAPLISEASIAGLREREATASAMAMEARELESREQARRLRAEQLRTERARRKALRSEQKAFRVGERVTVPDMPAMIGVVGKIVESNGSSAIIDFGGAISWKVEAWRVIPSALFDAEASTGIAA